MYCNKIFDSMHSHHVIMKKKQSAKMKDVNKIINCTEQKNDDLIASLTQSYTSQVL